MKSYTDLEQSKKLAEILPLESADMCFNTFNTRKSMPPLMTPYSRFNEFFDMEPTPAFLIPCWSLAALLEQLDDEITDENGNDYNLTIVKENLQYQLYYHDSWGQVEDIETDYYDDLVDACYEMIVKLKEMNLL